MKKNQVKTYLEFMTSGWNKVSAREIFGEERGGNLFGLWAQYTKHMVVDAATNLMFLKMTPDEQEQLIAYAEQHVA